MLHHALNLGRRLWSGPVGPLRYPEVSITGAITLDSSAWNRMHIFSGTSANYTVTLPACAGHAGDVIAFRMASALTKLVTLDGNASELIDGLTTRVMRAGESALLLCDGSNWFKIAGQSIPMVCKLIADSGTQTITTTTVTLVQLDTVIADNTGLMADITNERINIIRNGHYSIAVATSYETFTNASAYVIARIAKNAALFTEFSLTAAAGAATRSIIPNGGVLDIAAVGDYYDLRAYQQSTLSVDLDTAGAIFLSVVEVSTW